MLDEFHGAMWAPVLASRESFASQLVQQEVGAAFAANTKPVLISMDMAPSNLPS